MSEPVVKAPPLEIGRIIVAVDGSPFAERALPVAGWLARLLAADLHLVEVAGSEEEAEGANRHLDSVARRFPTTSWDVVRDQDVARGLALTIARIPRSLACLATHGRDRTAALVGSVAMALLESRDRPVLLVGPRARPVSAHLPIAVAVDDGTALEVP